ncbi:uncharacterized protein LOC143458760 [Clavelina lepadiformis]|uniref:uncharacterized protein LOC143458760 n=1 Tax=Clavelina lepadiformis TaxID=159417 RepID=UPI0040439191
MSDEKKTKHDTRPFLSKEQINILEIEYQRSKCISFDRQKQIAEEFQVKLSAITGWFLERHLIDEYKAREKTKLPPNSINLSENASSSSSLLTRATSQHNMTFPSLVGVGATSVTSQGNSSRSGQAAVTDPTLTSDQQNTTIQFHTSNTQGVLRKKIFYHCPQSCIPENKKMKRFESNRHEPETSGAANIMKHTQGSGQSSHQRQVNDDAAASSSYSTLASFTNSAPAEESLFDCQDQIDFTLRQLDFLEDEFAYNQKLDLSTGRLAYLTSALRAPPGKIERWFENKHKSIKKKKKGKFSTSASNTQNTGQVNAEAATSLPSTSSASSEQPAESSQDLEEEPEKSSWKPYAFSAEQNAGLQVAYRENPYLNDERTFALAIYFIIPVRHVDKWFHTRTRTRRGAYLKQKRLEEKQRSKRSTSSSSVVALTSSHIHRQDPSQQDGNEPHYLDGTFIKKIDQSNELAPLDVSDVIHVLGDQQDDANEPI